jgi:hypothetical protein
MSPAKRGRKVTVLGDTSDAYALAPLAQDSDVSTPCHAILSNNLRHFSQIHSYMCTHADGLVHVCWCVQHRC